jgi:hypothetical protein
MQVLEALREGWRGARAARTGGAYPTASDGLAVSELSQTITRLDIEPAWVRVLRQTFNNHDPAPVASSAHLPPLLLHPISACATLFRPLRSS